MNDLAPASFPHFPNPTWRRNRLFFCLCRGVPFVHTYPLYSEAWVGQRRPCWWGPFLPQHCGFSPNSPNSYLLPQKLFLVAKATKSCVCYLCELGLCPLQQNSSARVINPVTWAGGSRLDRHRVRPLKQLQLSSFGKCLCWLPPVGIWGMGPDFTRILNTPFTTGSICSQPDIHVPHMLRAPTMCNSHPTGFPDE